MNVTISLPDDLVRQAKHRAVDRRMSLSRYVASLLEEELGKKETERREAGERLLKMLEKGYNLGTHGKITWTREEIHER